MIDLLHNFNAFFVFIIFIELLVTLQFAFLYILFIANSV